MKKTLEINYAEYKGKNVLTFEYDGKTFVAGSYKKDTNKLPENVKKEIREMFEDELGIVNFQVAKDPEEVIVDEFAGSILLNNNEETMSNTIENFKRKTFFTEEKLAQIAELIDKAVELENDILVVAEKIDKITNVINEAVDDLSTAVDNGDYKTVNTLIKRLNAIVRFLESVDKISDIIKIGKELDKDNEDIDLDELKKELGLA